MLLNIILFVLFTFVVIAITTLNTIMTKEALRRELTFSEIISENQDTRISKILMGVLCIPCYIILKTKSLLPINTQSCFNEEEKTEIEKPQYKFYNLSEVINLPLKQKIVVGPDNYKWLLKRASTANKNADVDIEIHNECVQERFLDSFAFYGVKLNVLTKYRKENGMMKYIITCYNANRPD